MCRLSITQTEKRCSAIDGGNGKAPSLFETIGGVTPTLRLVSSFQPGLAGAPQGPGFLYSSRFGGGSLPTPLPAGTHAWGVAMGPMVYPMLHPSRSNQSLPREALPLLVNNWWGKGRRRRGLLDFR